MEPNINQDFSAGDGVRVTVLGRTETEGLGRVERRSSYRVDLLSEKPAPMGSAIKLEGEDTLFLGEVRSCQPCGGVFAMVVDLKHALYHTEDLARLARRILDAERL